jgi:hypothetical protein
MAWDQSQQMINEPTAISEVVAGLAARLRRTAKVEDRGLALVAPTDRSNIRTVIRTIFLFVTVMVAMEALGQDHQDWSKVTNQVFSFSIPASWKKSNVKGMDSYHEEYLGAGIKLSFSLGRYENKFEDWPAETKFGVVNISGWQGRIGTAKREFHKGYPYSTQIYVKVDELLALSMFAACKTENEVAVARKVFETVSIEKKFP